MAKQNSQETHAFGVATEIEGTVEAKGTNGQVRALLEGGAVFKGESIITGPDSGAYIDFMGRGFANLGANQSLKLDRHITGEPPAPAKRKAKAKPAPKENPLPENIGQPESEEEKPPLSVPEEKDEMEEEEGSSFTVVEQLAARGEVTAGFLTKPPGPAETKTIATRDPLPDEAPPQNDSGPSIRISPVVSDKKANPGEPALSDNVFRHAGTDGLRLQIDESWLPEGSLYNGGGLPVYEARFLIASNDGIDCIAIDEIPFHIGEEGVLTAAEEHGDCRFNGSWGHLTGSVSAIDDGLYILHLFYTQTSAVAHDTGQKLPMTAGAEFFGIAVYSETGKSSHSCLSIAIADDTPVLSLLSSAGSVFEGEVLTGSWDVKMGADAEKSTIHVEYKNRQYGIGEVIEIDGGGSLTVGEDHTWTFTARPNDIYRNADQAVTFSVVAEDGDGDIVSKSLSFSARDDLSDVVTVKLSATEEIEEDGRNGKNLITYTATLVDRNQNPVTAQSDVRASLDLDDGSKTEIIIAKGSSSGVSEPVHYSGPNVYRDDCSLSAKITGVSQDSPDLPGAFENLHFDGTPVLTRVTDTIDVTYANVFIQAEGEDVVVRVVLDSPPDAGRTATVTVLVNGVEYTLNFTDADIAQSVVLEGALRQSAITDKVSVSAEILSFDAADTGNYEAAQPGDNAKAAEVFYVAPRTVTVGLSASDVFEDAPDTSYVFTATLSEAAPAGGVAVITSLGSIHIAEGKTQGELVISSGQTEDVWLDATSLTAAVLSVESAFLNVTGAGEEATAFVRDTIDVTCASVFIHADGEDVVVRVLLDSPPDAGRTTAVAVLINEIEHTLNFTDADVTQSVVLEGALRQSAISDRVSVTAEIISFDADGAGNFEAAQLGHNAKAAEVFDVAPRMVTVGLSASDIFENAVDASYVFTATLSETAPAGGATVITSLGSIYIAEGDAQGKLVISSGQTEDVWLDATSLTATVLSVESAFLNVVGAGEEATAFVRDTIDVTYANLFIHADGEDVVVRVLLDNPPDATREARVTVLVNGTEYTLNFTDADVAQKVVLEGALRQSAIADRVSVAAEIISFDADGAGNFEAAQLGNNAKAAEVFDVAPRMVAVGLSASDIFENAVDASYVFTATLSEAAPVGGVTVITSLGSIHIAEGDAQGKLVISSGQTEDVWLDATSLTATVLSVESAFLNVVGAGGEATAFVRDTIDVTYANLFIHADGEDVVVRVLLDNPPDATREARVTVLVNGTEYTLNFTDADVAQKVVLEGALRQSAIADRVSVAAEIISFDADGAGNYEAARLGPYAKTGEDFYVAPRAVTVGLSASDVFEDALDSSYEFTATLSEAAPAGGVTVMTSLGSIYIAEGDTEGKLAIPSGQTEDVWLDASSLTAVVLSVESAFLNVTGPGEEATAFVRDTIDVTTASVFISQGESPGDLVVTVRLSAPADPAIPGGKAAVSVMIGKESFILEFAGSETEKELILQNHLLNNADSEGNVEVEAVIAGFTGGNYESHGGTGSRAIAEFKLPPGPVAADDHAIIDEDGPKTITGNVLANDEGADISVTPESTVSDVRIDYGWLSLKADGSYTFLLDETDEDVVALFAGTDGSGGMLQTSFDYAIVDGLGRSSEATLLIDIIDNRQIIGTSGDDIISGGQGRDVIVGDPGAEGFSSFVPDMNVAVVFDVSASMLGNGFDEARLALAQLVLQYSGYEGNVNMSITAFSTDISASISNSSLDSPNITAGEIRTDSFATVRVHGEAVTVGVLSDGTVISDRSDLEFRLNNGVLQYRTRETSLPSDWTANFLNVPSEWYGGAMIEAVLGLEADDETNFEAGLNAASYWLQNQNDAINVVYFICDGMPTNYYRDTATAPVTINNDRAVSILDYNRMVAGMKSAVSISGNSITLTYEGNRVVSSDSEIHQFRLNPINSRLEYSSSTQGWTAVAGHVDWVLSVAVPDHNVPDLYWAGVQVWYDSAGNQTGIQYPGQSIEGTSQDASWWIDESGRFLRWDGSEWHEVREQVLRHGAGTATTAVELEQSKAAFDRLVDAFTDEHGATHVYVFTIGISLTPENMGFLDGLDNTGGAFAISHARELFDALRESQVDFYHALAGNDIIHGGPGEDIIFGDAINADHLLPEITEGTWAAGLHAGDGLKILAAWLDADNAHGFTGSGEGVRQYLAHLAGSGNEDDFAELLRLGSSETHRGGSDILAGGEGNDILFGQAGNDVIFGGEVHYAGLKGASAIMKLIDGAGGSVEDVSAFLAARPETFLEMRAHGSESDGENLLCGGLGNDILIGGGMNDILVGGAGDNILFGGKGSDIFVYSGASLEGKESGDVILDFNAGSVDGDILDIRDLLTDLDLDNDLNALFDGGGLSLKVEKGEGDTATVVLGIDHAGHAGSIASIHMSGVLLDDTLGSLEEQLLMQLVDGNHILF